MSLQKMWRETWLPHALGAILVLSLAMSGVKVLAQATDARLSAEEARGMQLYATSKRLRAESTPPEETANLAIAAEKQRALAEEELAAVQTVEAATEEVYAPSNAPRPEDLTIGKIWTEWCRFESGFGEASYWQTGGGGGYSYGKYQFDIRFSVGQFLGVCIDTGDPVYVAEFSPFVTNPGNGYVLLTDEGLGDAWRRVCEQKGGDFFQRQTNFAMNHYYKRVERRLLDIYQINLNEYSAVLKGTVWSISVRDGSSVNLDRETNNLYAVTSTYYPGIDEATWLNAIYDAETARHPDQAKRWDIEQRDLALRYLEGLTTGTVNAGALAPL